MLATNPNPQRRDDRRDQCRLCRLRARAPRCPLFLAGDGFFLDRRVQFATLTARDRIPATGAESPFVKAGGLMSYGTDLAETSRQVGAYTGRILKGEKPAELPVLQSTKFELVINLQTARALDIEVPNSIQLLADEVIE